MEHHLVDHVFRGPKLKVFSSQLMLVLAFDCVELSICLKIVVSCFTNCLKRLEMRYMHVCVVFHHMFVT